MIEIDNKIISREVFDKKFVCDLASCKGACCVEGDSGAPLLESEIEELEKIHPIVEKYLTKEGKDVIKKVGVFVIDEDGDLTTPLINNKQCAYLVENNGISKCGIEKAYQDKKINFKKPISCHLYPIRVTDYDSFEAVNYEANKLCSAACSLGQELQVSVYKFLKEPLIRKYGKEFFKEMDEVNNNL